MWKNASSFRCDWYCSCESLKFSPTNIFYSSRFDETNKSIASIISNLFKFEFPCLFYCHLPLTFSQVEFFDSSSLCLVTCFRILISVSFPLWNITVPPFLLSTFSSYFFNLIDRFPFNRFPLRLPSYFTYSWTALIFILLQRDSDLKLFSPAFIIQQRNFTSQLLKIAFVKEENHKFELCAIAMFVLSFTCQKNLYQRIPGEDTWVDSCLIIRH